MSDDILTEGHILYAGVGNILRGDDGIGCYIADGITSSSINAGENSEAIYFEALNIKPEKVIIFDAYDFSGAVGEWRFVKPEQLEDSTVSTHKMPLNLVCQLIKEDVGADIYLIGIQPESLEPGSKLTDTVKNEADKIVSAINKDF